MLKLKHWFTSLSKFSLIFGIFVIGIVYFDTKIVKAEYSYNDKLFELYEEQIAQDNITELLTVSKEIQKHVMFKCLRSESMIEDKHACIAQELNNVGNQLGRLQQILRRNLIVTKKVFEESKIMDPVGKYQLAHRIDKMLLKLDSWDWSTCDWQTFRLQITEFETDFYKMRIEMIKILRDMIRRHARRINGIIADAYIIIQDSLVLRKKREMRVVMADMSELARAIEDQSITDMGHLATEYQKDVVTIVEKFRNLKQSDFNKT